MEKGETEANEEQQEVTLTEQLVKDLLQLLANNNMEVRHGTISAILQYTPTVEAKLMFKDTTLMSFLRKYVFQPKLSTICLSTLIHFATQTDFLPEYFKLIEPLVLKMKEWKGLELELSLLLLLNISKEEQIIFRVIGEEDKKGYLMEVLYTLLEKEEKLRWIVVGVFVNVSAAERGRRFLVEDLIAVRFVQYLCAFDERLRQASLTIIRNCSFEWQYQPFTSQMFKSEQQLFPRLVKLLLFLIYRQNLIHDLTHTRLLIRKLYSQEEILRFEKGFISSQKEKALGEVQLGIDILLVLSNANLKERKVEIDSDSFKELLSLLKFTEIKEETKDKLEALEIFGLG